ncbi:hypothetical protein GS584_19010 [Rhodococcus hoagii]|nr:hypothetical protein [Prescottella equi]
MRHEGPVGGIGERIRWDPVDVAAGADVEVHRFDCPAQGSGGEPAVGDPFCAVGAVIDVGPTGGGPHPSDGGRVVDRDQSARVVEHPDGMRW